ncbi:hypothetical protein [Mycobacteroides salmoniphilum]|uniref:Uncharacterized protein n=1 Tax=Mycobacteroides salmoniphilum TaxID=404941 RepID=A0A4R8SHF8_9MYCO|nr:hypothetical protein [Mycobacteroides salmoniphilum]TDZ96334.1 hypothetical protein CCUG60885_02478 [Mycobacteroides salmoniphilum]TEA05429.1 hypothetical protein CCUG60883_02735 [Mycobacteroides salmoniphilum]
MSSDYASPGVSSRISLTLVDTTRSKVAPVAATAQGLVADASSTELAVLATELPDYLKSRGQVDPSWVDQQTATVSPELNAAITDANAKALAYTQHNHQLLVNKVTKTQSPAGYRPPSFVPLPEQLRRAGTWLVASG